MNTKDLKHPMQPIGWDETGEVIRFKKNKIVDFLLDVYKPGLNDIAMRNAMGEFGEGDYTQLMQLIGYSVSGFGNLSTSPKAIVRKADRKADALCKLKKESEND